MQGLSALSNLKYPTNLGEEESSLDEEGSKELNNHLQSERDLIDGQFEKISFLDKFESLEELFSILSKFENLNDLVTRNIISKKELDQIQLLIAKLKSFEDSNAVKSLKICKLLLVNARIKRSNAIIAIYFSLNPPLTKIYQERRVVYYGNNQKLRLRMAKSDLMSTPRLHEEYNRTEPQSKITLEEFMKVITKIKKDYLKNYVRRILLTEQIKKSNDPDKECMLWILNKVLDGQMISNFENVSSGVLPHGDSHIHLESNTRNKTNLHIIL